MSQTAENDAIGPIVLINLFTVKPGRMDEFIELQKRNLDRSPGNVPGWRGSRLHRSTDGRTALMMSLFDTIADHKRLRQNSRFAEHVRKLMPLIEGAEPTYYEVVHEALGP
ncbi:MAG TPA: antibiotic biosynthesis monooxygenase family protein [Rhizobiaceae bacterium]